MERGAHRAQRFDDTSHRSAAQRIVAVEVVVIGSPARIPLNSRRLVPELPQSRTPAGSRRPSAPGDTTR
jgi:hypothetical protein